MPEPHEHCPGCMIQFGYVTEHDRVAMCRDCEIVMHWDCLERHVCPKRVEVDKERLATWTAAVRGEKPDG